MYPPDLTLKGRSFLMDEMASQAEYLLRQTLQGGTDPRLANISPADKIAAAQASALVALAHAVNRLADQADRDRRF